MLSKRKILRRLRLKRMLQERLLKLKRRLISRLLKMLLWLLLMPNMKLRLPNCRLSKRKTISSMLRV